MSPRLRKQACGTRRGYRAHRRHGEEVCEPCRAANARYALQLRNAAPERDRARQRKRRAETSRLNPVVRATPDQRFDSKWVIGEPPVERPELGPCHTWNAFKEKDGYGRFWLNGKNIPAHRYAVLRDGREIPPGYEPDHLCRNTSCVNAAHIEVVTQRENVARGAVRRRGRAVGRAAQLAAQTHCKRNHEFTPENTRVIGIRRQCRECDRLRHRKGVA